VITMLFHVVVLVKAMLLHRCNFHYEASLCEASLCL